MNRYTEDYGVLTNMLNQDRPRKNIKYLRTKANLTQKDLAEALGYNTQSVISELEKGSRSLSLLQIINIARFFGVSLDALVFENLTDNRRKAIRSKARDAIKVNNVEICPHCKRILDEGRFCQYCGQEISRVIDWDNMPSPLARGEIENAGL